MLISVAVKPNSKKGPLIEKVSETEFIIFLREKPHDGEANTALLKLLSEYFHVPKTTIKIKSGPSSRKKILEIPEF